MTYLLGLSKKLAGAGIGNGIGVGIGTGISPY